MNPLKEIILLPASKLENYAMTEGEFNSKGRQLAQFFVVLTVITLVADPILAMIRYGNFVLQDAWFYVVSIVCVGLIAMVARSGSEKSIQEMRDSSNVLVKGLIYTIFSLVVAFEFVAKLLLPLIEVIGRALENSDVQTEDDINNANWNNMGTTGKYGYNEHMNDYMIGARDDPPTGWH